MQRTRFPALAAGALVIALGMTACSKQERNYEIPESLCGTPVSTEILDPFLPPGNEVSVKLSAKAEGLKRCLVYVDGKQALALNTDWWKAGTPPSEVASVFPGVDPGDKESEDGRYLYSETGAIGEVTCPEPRKAGRKLFVATRTGEVGKPGEAAMRKLIAAYAEAVGKSGECT